MSKPIKTTGCTRVHCNNCELEVHTCELCDSYLRKEKEIICLDGIVEHFCSMDCYKEWKENKRVLERGGEEVGK